MHCKAGRGRSTSLVLCYLIKHHRMAPPAALEFVRSKRQQVRLSPVSRRDAVAAPAACLSHIWAARPACFSACPAGEALVCQLAACIAAKAPSLTCAGAVAQHRGILAGLRLPR